VSGLPWGVEPHDIPIGEQWGGRCAGLPHLLVAMIGSSGRGAPDGDEASNCVHKEEASREKDLSCGSM
jgi:hypothetical protein